MSKPTTGRIVGILSLRVALLCGLVVLSDSLPVEMMLVAAAVLGVVMPEVVREDV